MRPFVHNRNSVYLNIQFLELAGGCAGFFLKSAVKAADTVKATVQGNVDHFAVGGLQKKNGQLDLFLHHILLEGNAVDPGKLPPASGGRLL